MSEKSQVENPCVRWASERNIPALKVNPLWYAGWNDRIFFIPGGKPVIIEFKAPGVNKVRPKQVARHKNLKELGYDVQVFDDKGAALRYLQQRLDEAPKGSAARARRSDIASSTGKARGTAPSRREPGRTARAKAHRLEVESAAVHGEGDAVASRAPRRRANPRPRSS